MKQTAYIFDVDGVLNNLQVYETDQRIIAHMADLLDNDTFVAINTGRGYVWVEENVVQPIRRKVRNDTSLSRLFVSTEMGGLGVEFVNGEERKIHSAFSITDEQVAQVRQVFDEHPEYADRVGWYPKESMATLDKTSTASLDDFHPVQHILHQILEGMFKGQHIKITDSTDAIDVHAPEAGKWAGAQLIYEWLRRTTDIEHDRFICFGDSLPDYQMARFFAAQSHDTTFVFTGLNFEKKLDPNIRLVKTSQPYHEGTYEYLQAHPSRR
ncbi:MAG TPA: hypothetical protein VLH86_06480 [Patescibacteria group bacterium]|nr:hypothetical protein [Patescibacteria group bacterium]